MPLVKKKLVVVQVIVTSEQSGWGGEYITYSPFVKVINPMVYCYYTIVFYGDRSRVNSADIHPYF